MQPVIMLVVSGIFMFAVIGGISLMSHYYTLNGIKNRTVGDGQHGTARWATDKEIRRIAYFYLRLCRTGDYERCFCDILAGMYKRSWINAREDGSIVLFLNQKFSPVEERRGLAIQSIFLQAGRKCRTFWDIPPGIVECQETTIGNFVLF